LQRGERGESGGQVYIEKVSKGTEKAWTRRQMKIEHGEKLYKVTASFKKYGLGGKLLL
jgi:hypothetical protein